MKPILTILFSTLLSASQAQQVINRNTEHRTALPAGNRLQQVQIANPKKIRICIDQPRSSSLPPHNQHEIFKIPRVGRDGKLIQPARLQQGLSSVTAQMWAPGDTITIGFYKNETSDKFINKVKQYAREWEKVAYIFFSFVDNVNTAAVRVGFANGFSWSYLGRDVLNAASNVRTVNFGWLNDESTEAEMRSVILHEFGHVLGFIHEHNSPMAEIPWDKEKVYSVFGDPPNSWSKEIVDRNIFQKYNAGETNFSAYDKHSIMHYYFPEELTSNKTVFHQNFVLSPVDIRFAGVFYPFPVNPTGTLFTGDDCDEIDFKIEYNVLPKHLVEFILQPGIDKRGNKISWWKQISVPLLGGVAMNLELAPSGLPDKKTIHLPILDKGRMLSFAKAKALGVHTGLGFRWDILPAVIGGCRVTMTWRNDHCY